MAAIKQTIKRKKLATNKNANYKLVYKKAVKQTSNSTKNSTKYNYTKKVIAKNKYSYK